MGGRMERITYFTDDTLGGDGQTRVCMGNECFKIDEDPLRLMKRLKEAVRQGRSVGINAIVGVVPGQHVKLVPRIYKGVVEEMRRDDEIECLRKERVRRREIDEQALPGAWIWSSQSSDLLGLMGVDSRVLQVLGIYKKDCEGKTKWKYPDVLLRKFELNNTGINSAIWSLGIGWFMLDGVREDEFNIQIETAMGNRPILEEASLRFGLTKTAPVIGLEGEFVNLTGRFGKGIVDHLLRGRIDNFEGTAKKFKVLERGCVDRSCNRLHLSFDRRYQNMAYWCEVMASQCQRYEEVIWRQFGNNRDRLK